MVVKANTIELDWVDLNPSAGPSSNVICKGKGDGGGFKNPIYNQYDWSAFGEPFGNVTDVIQTVDGYGCTKPFKL